jgi:hypothetical protein
LGSGSREIAAAEWIWKRKDVLPFGELEALASAFLTVLLPLMLTRIARKKAETLQFASELGIKFNQGTRNAEPGGPSLPADPTAMGEDQDIEPVCSLRGEQRLAHIGAGRLAYEVILKRPVIDGDLTFTGPQENTRGGGFAPAGS